MTKLRVTRYEWTNDGIAEWAVSVGDKSWFTVSLDLKFDWHESPPAGAEEQPARIEAMLRQLFTEFFDAWTQDMVQRMRDTGEEDEPE